MYVLGICSQCCVIILEICGCWLLDYVHVDAAYKLGKGEDSFEGVGGRFPLLGLCRKKKHARVSSGLPGPSTLVDINPMSVIHSFQLELSRTHTPCAPGICTAVQVMLTISTRLVLCMSTRNRACMQWARSMGVATMANKKTLFVTLVGRAKRSEAHLSQFFFPISTDWLHLWVSQRSRCQDLVIFMDGRWQTKPTALPLAHAHGVMKHMFVVGRHAGLHSVHFSALHQHVEFNNYYQ